MDSIRVSEVKQPERFELPAVNSDEGLGLPGYLKQASSYEAGEWRG